MAVSACWETQSATLTITFKIVRSKVTKHYRYFAKTVIKLSFQIFHKRAIFVQGSVITIAGKFPPEGFGSRLKP